MEIQDFINQNQDYLSQFKKMGVKVRSFRDLLILSLPYHKQPDQDILIQMRGVVVDKKNHKIVCVPPQKSIVVNQVEDIEYENIDEDIEYEELIDGTMINLFYHNEWLISTRTEIGGYNKWSDNKSFKKMFDEARDFELDDLSKEYCYSFVLRHRDNRNVSPIIEDELYLVEMYHISEEIKRVDRKDFPDTCKQVNYLTDQKKMLQLNETSYYIKGYTMKLSDQDKRYKIQNTNYERIKNIKTDMNNDLLIYLELRRKGDLKEYLKYYPEKTTPFKGYRNKVHLLSNELYTSYKNVFIYKKSEKKEIPYHIKPLMYDIHKKYLENKIPIKWGDIKDYIYHLNSKKLYFAISQSNH